MYYFYMSYRIPFSETDAMSIVHHTNHPRYFERGRVELLRQIGFNYTKVMERGIHFPLTAMNVTFKKPLRFDDIILIETKISRLHRVRLNFSYRLLRGTELKDPFITSEALPNDVLALGVTEHCGVNNDGKPCEMDEDMVAVLQKHFRPEGNA